MSRNTSGLKRGGSLGRPKGVPNRATQDAKEFCGGIVSDPTYQERLRIRALDGTLPPVLECMLWHYAFGRPSQRIEHGGHLSVSGESELVERLKRGRQRVAQMRAEPQGAIKPSN
jgi:hypothetical protein